MITEAVKKQLYASLYAVWTGVFLVLNATMKASLRALGYHHNPFPELTAYARGY